MLLGRFYASVSDCHQFLGCQNRVVVSGYPLGEALHRVKMAQFRHFQLRTTLSNVSAAPATPQGHTQAQAQFVAPVRTSRREAAAAGHALAGVEGKLGVVAAAGPRETGLRTNNPLLRGYDLGVVLKRHQYTFRQAQGLRRLFLG